LCSHFIEQYLLKETTGCARCQAAAEEGEVVEGKIALTVPLAKRLGEHKITNLTPEEINPYLQKELHWRVQLVCVSDPNSSPFAILPWLYRLFHRFNITLPILHSSFELTCPLAG
jgi:hypothetical protein